MHSSSKKPGEKGKKPKNEQTKQDNGYTLHRQMLLLPLSTLFLLPHNDTILSFTSKLLGPLLTLLHILLTHSRLGILDCLDKVLHS